VKRAGLERRSPKDLRDTYASWLLSLGVQLGYVSQQLGHSGKYLVSPRRHRIPATILQRTPPTRVLRTAGIAAMALAAALLGAPAFAITYNILFVGTGPLPDGTITSPTPVTGA